MVRIIIYMHRQPFLETLYKYRESASKTDIQITDELIGHVLKNKDCFYRNREEGAKDIAASVLLLSKDLKKGLFIWHKKIQEWTQPGGHADGESNIFRVAHKELEEETGIVNVSFLGNMPFHIHKFDYAPHVFGYRKSIFNIFFVAKLPPNQKPRIIEPTKCEKMRWLSKEEIISIIKSNPHESIIELINKWDNLTQN